MLFRHRFANAAGDFVDIELVAVAPLHFLHDDEAFLSARIENGECRAETGPQARGRRLRRVLDILRIVVGAAHDNHILDAAGNEDFARSVDEAEVAGTQPIGIALAGDSRRERLARRGIVAPIATGNVAALHQYFADTVTRKLRPGLRIDDGDLFAG